MVHDTSIFQNLGHGPRSASQSARRVRRSVGAADDRSRSLSSKDRAALNILSLTLPQY